LIYGERKRDESRERSEREGGDEHGQKEVSVRGRNVPEPATDRSTAHQPCGFCSK